MPSHRTCYGVTWIFCVTVLLSISSINIAAGAQTAKPQTTVETSDAGGGNKTQLVRDASGEVIETRTLASDGKLSVVSTYERRPGYLVPQQTTTSYFPDGKSPSVITKVTYDANSNFLSETMEYFDTAGKHVSGHQLTHDPENGMFRCWKWMADSHNYKRVVCPSGEESGEKPPPLPHISQEEAVKLLDKARTTAVAEEKSRRMTPKQMVTPADKTVNVKVGFLAPNALTPGKTVSGSLVEDPDDLKGRPDYSVTDFTLPLPSGSEAGKLSGWRVTVAGSQPQAADGPIAFVVPASASSIEVKVYPDGEPNQAVTQSIAIPKKGSSRDKGSSAYLAQALCIQGDICPIGGVFTGDATHALASFNDIPAAIVAETENMAYIRVPPTMDYGTKQLLFNEGNELIAFPVVAAMINIEPYQRTLPANGHKLVFADAIGIQSLPEENWRAGIFPKSNLDWARSIVPGFEVPHETHAEREEREMMEKMEYAEKGQKPPAGEKEEKLGTIVYFLKNSTPDLDSWRGAKNNAFVLPLNPESFSQGDFRYKFVVEASKAGTFGVSPAVIPFVAPSQGQKFTLPQSAAAR